MQRAARRTFKAMAVVPLLLTAGVVTANAWAADDGCHPVEVEAINEFVAEAEITGVDGANIDRSLETRYCLTKVSSEVADEVTTLDSTHADVDWYNMTIFHDGHEGNYLAKASWNWRNNNFTKDETIICVTNNIGGHDGVGIRFSGGDMRIIGKSAQAWGNTAVNNMGNDFGNMTVPHSEVGEYGVGFKAQDKGRKMKSDTGGCIDGKYDFNMYSGTVTITFEALNGCKNVQMYPGYAHTWDSTGINSIGAGPWSFSVGWSTTSDRWIKEENGPSARVC
jgi:hypothetical protein